MREITVAMLLAGVILALSAWAVHRDVASMNKEDNDVVDATIH